MALFPRNKVFTISAVDTYVLGDVSDGTGGAYVIHIVGNGVTGSLTIQGRARGYGVGATPAFLPIGYRSLYATGAAVAWNTGATAAIIATALIFVPAAGLDIAIDCTALSAGTFTVYVTPVTHGSPA